MLKAPPICSFISISALEDAARAMTTSSAVRIPPEYEITGDASSSVAPDRATLAYCDSVTIPAHRAPKPVEETVAESMFKLPSTLILTPSETLTETPSSIDRVRPNGIIKSSSR